MELDDRVVSPRASLIGGLPPVTVSAPAIGAGRGQHLNRLHVPAPAGAVQRRAASCITGPNLGPGVEERGHDRRVPDLRRERERRPSQRVALVRVSARREQDLRTGRMSAPEGTHERGIATRAKSAASASSNVTPASSFGCSRLHTSPRLDRSRHTTSSGAQQSVPTAEPVRLVGIPSAGSVGADAGIRGARITG
jgi:hypothetical protein